MYSPVLITAPEIYPITLLEAKAQLDVDYADKDSLISGLIAAAAAHLQSTLEIPLCEQSWSQSYDEICGELTLPKAPVISITSVKYRDANGVEQTIDPANYTLVSDGMTAAVRFASGYTAPTLYSVSPAVTAIYKAGWANEGTDPDFTSTVPDDIKQAMLLLIRHWFDNPNAVVIGVTVAKLPHAVDALLSPYRPMNV